MKKLPFATGSRLFVTSVLTGGALLFAASNALSQETLADLAAGGTLTVPTPYGGLVFYDFSNISQVGDLNVPLADIYVVPTFDDGNYGVQFQSALWSLGGASQNYDLGFNFQVAAVNGHAIIEDDNLALTGGILFAGATHVAETVSTVDDTSLSSLLVYINSSGQSLENDATFTGGGAYDVIKITKDFSMNTGADPLSQVFVSHFIQTFSVVSEVPEPSTLALAGLSGLGMLLFRRRK
jgi:hypothetical protein